MRSLWELKINEGKRFLVWGNLILIFSDIKFNVNFDFDFVLINGYFVFIFLCYLLDLFDSG